MKWIVSIKGDLRKRKGFLLFPKGSVQMRWLEYAEWQEEYDGISWHFDRWLC